jgi:1-acyl-sn-glycerol-3-phosphate acyltransferase
MKGIDEAVTSISIGESVVIFAEGTRSKDGRLAAFKRGAFLLASRSGKQIIPIALAGAHQVMPKDSKRFYPGDVEMTILPAFDTMKDMDKEDELMLQSQVHESINAALPYAMKSQIQNTK